MSTDNSEHFRTIRVFNIPENVTEDKLKIYFQRRKNGGGEVKEVRMLDDVHEALVVFDEVEVAETILKREHKINDIPISVEMNGEATHEDHNSQTVQVSNLPLGITKDTLFIHFQKKKNGGGEVEKVTMLPGGNAAVVVFEDRKVVCRVLNKEQIIQGKTVDVSMLPERENQVGQIQTKTRTIKVTNLPKSIAETTLHMHFQKKKNGGGEVEKVTLLPESEAALVVFEDPQVAREVVKKAQIINGKTVQVSLLEESENEDQTTSEEPCPRTIVVSDLPERITKNNLHIYFQKKKNEGGEIKEVRFSQEKQQAFVVYEDPNVARAVIKRRHIILGKEVTVKLAENEEQNQESPRRNGKMVLVSDLPEGITTNNVKIHFQKKKNAGGEVQKVKLSHDGKNALVFFEDPEVAQSVVNTRQIIGGKVVKVSGSLDEDKMQTKPELVSDIPKGTEHRLEKKSNNMSGSNNTRKSNDKAGQSLVQDEQRYPEGRQDTTITEHSNVVKEHTSTQRRSTKEIVNRNNFEPPRKVNQVEEQPSKTQEAVYLERTILVSDIPDGVTETNVVIYFQRKNNGGGEVEKAKMFPEDRKALVIFAEPRVVEQVLQKNHTLNGKDVRVEKYDPSPKKVEVENVFTTVTATMNPTILQRIEPSVCKAMLDETGAVTGIQWHYSAYGLLITGSLEQVIKAGEFLQLKMGNKCLEEAEARNDNYDGKSHEHGVKNPSVKQESQVNWSLRSSHPTVKEDIPSCEFDGHENKHSSPSHGESQSSGMSWETDYRRSTQNQVTLPRGNTDTAFAGKTSEHLGEQMDTSETAPAVDQKIRVSHDSGAQAYPIQLKETKDPRANEQSSAKPTKLERYYNQPNNQTHESGPRSLDGSRNRQNSEQTSDGASAKSRSPAEGLQGLPVQPAKPTPVPRLSHSQKDAGGDTARSENLKKPTSQNREPFPERRQNAAKFTSHPGNTATAKSQNNAKQTTSLEFVADKKNGQDSFQGNVKKSDKTSYSDQSGFHDDEFQKSPSNRGKKVIDESGTEGDNLLESFNNSEESDFGNSDFKKSGIDDNDFQRSQSNNQDPAKNAEESGTLGDNFEEDLSNSEGDNLLESFNNSEESDFGKSDFNKSGFDDNEFQRSQSNNQDPAKNADKSGAPGDNFEEDLHNSEKPPVDKRISDNDDQQKSHTTNPDQTSLYQSKTNGENFQADFNRFKKLGPDYKNERPDYENEKPDYENERPADYENEKPADHKNEKPDYENEKPTDHKNEKPGFENERPDYENPRPNYDNSQNDPLEFLQNSLEKIKLHDEPDEPSSISVAQFIQQVYKEDLETFKSQNRVDVVLSEDKRLTLKPMRGFKQSEFDEVARKLQQFYETTSKNLTRATLDLRQLSADDAEKIKKSMTRQRGRSDIMIDESSPDVFTLIGNAENVEMFRRNAMGALQRETSASENKGTIPTDPMVASRKGTRVILMLGEIQKQECDAIVNFTDKDLVHKTGLPCAIREAAGEEFWKVCRDIIARNGSLITNMVTLTSAGSLPCQIVIHAILPEMSKERRQEVLRLSLKETCHNALKRANENRVKSICFPVVTPDIANLSPAVSARLLFEVIKEFMDANSPLDNNSIEEIRIVYRKTSRCVEEYMKEFTKQF